MDDEDADLRDFVYGRVQAIRNIAADLDSVKNKDARELLKKAGDLALQHLALKSAEIVEISPAPAKSVRERPL